MRTANKLVLFDIDGTLITTTKESVTHWKTRVSEVFREVYGKELDSGFDLSVVNGKVERRYFREIAQMLGVPAHEFAEKFGVASELFHVKLRRMISSGEVTFTRIEDAYTFVASLTGGRRHRVGLITGNIEKNAWLKLTSADFVTPFETGGFGDEIEDRGALVLSAIERANAHFGTSFRVSDTVVVGDTVHDIAAAKYAGAYSIGVTTGLTDSFDHLASAGADLVVRTLMDRRVLALF